jgi:hypothetical protein
VNLDKADVKIAVACDLGARVEDSLEAAKAEVIRQEGSTSAFIQGTKACEALATHVDKDIDEGKFDLECAAHVKRYVERCANAMRNLGAHAEQGRIHALGKVAAYETTVKVVAKYRDEEQQKAMAVREALARGGMKKSEGGAIVEDHTRPKLSIKERRLAESAVESPTPDVPKPKRGRPKKCL